MSENKKGETMHYFPNSNDTQKKMLDFLGIDDFEKMLTGVPSEVRLKKELKLPEEISEYKLKKELSQWLKNSSDTNQMISFLGGGSYDHFVPATIPFLLSRSEFYTAYTPYQAEVSQGTLQAYFEFQSLICDLTKMEVCNASMYDGATAAAEAILMAERIKPGKKILISESIAPSIRQVISTYNLGLKLDIETVPIKNGRMDDEKLKNYQPEEISAILIQSPNCYGILEDIDQIQTRLSNQTLVILYSDLISLGILKKPGDYGVDIFISDGQVAGNFQNFGGPSCGIFATKKKYIRQIPGRIVGMTEDVNGKIGFVTTLQTREQHIRRAKATSNICTSQALNALATTIFLTTVGRQGLFEMAYQSTQKAHYLAGEMIKIQGFELFYSQPFFQEFVVKTPVPADQIVKKAIMKNIFAGIAIDKNLLMIAVTEKRTKEEIDAYLSFLQTLVSQKGEKNV